MPFQCFLPSCNGRDSSIHIVSHSAHHPRTQALAIHHFVSITDLKLLLSEPARFAKKLEDICHELGKPLRLECTYTGSQRVNVTWKKDGKLIWASYQYNVKTTASSCVLEVLYSDRAAAAGHYTCEISNAEGTDTCHAHVKIGNILTHLHLTVTML